MSTERSVSRRGFLRAATGAAAATAATSGSAAAAESGGSGGKTVPDFGGYLDGANNGDAVEDLRGNSEVTVKVGAGSQGLAFDPAGIWIDSGTTVKWEWTGNGGAHNVIAGSGPADLNSGSAVSGTGVKYEYTFEETGITEYYCRPHQSLGMLGAVAVGDDVPTKTVSTPAPGGSGPQVPDAAKTIGVASFTALLSTLGVAYFFLKYGGGRAPE